MNHDERFLSKREQRILTALAEAVVAPGRRVPGAGPQTVGRLERAAAQLGTPAQRLLRTSLWSLEIGATLGRGRPFSSLDLFARRKALDRWRANPALQPGLRLLIMVVKIAWLADPEVYAALGLRYAADAPDHAEQPRWLEGITDASELEPDEPLECDVVVVGTGAGGAPVAAALAARGHAVLILEAGRHATRTEFNARPIEMMARFYERSTRSLLIGNAFIPVPTGRVVGGSTTINSGTCFRTPDEVLLGWGRDFGLLDLSPARMAPWFETVERDIHVQPGEWRYIGGPGRVIARGCDALGFTHGPLSRNAMSCDGQGVCCFGCPTDAKRSTNVSYIPAALEQHAMLVTGARVDRVRTEGGRAVGVRAVCEGPDGRPRHLEVRARAVVLSTGTMTTPILLLRQDLANRSGQVGRNLSVHPASHAVGLFDEAIDPERTIPQGYGVESFVDEGIRFEGASVPLELPGAGMDEFGPAFTQIVENYGHLATFGFMIRDSSRGRVSIGAGGHPVATYWMNRSDNRKLRRGMEILARIFFAAGARRVYPGLARGTVLHDLDDVRRMARQKLRPHHFDMSAYHPLGTARMGVDPRRSVVGPDHECHDLPGLFVCDGSVVPSSLGVNPQVTIMALALRAAERIDHRLHASS